MPREWYGANKRVVWVTVLVFMLGSASAFTTAESRGRVLPHAMLRSRPQDDAFRRKATSSSDNEEESHGSNIGHSEQEDNHRPRKKHSVGRYGGRATKKSTVPTATATEKITFPWKTAAAAALLLWIFSGNDTTSSSGSYYVYSYSSASVRDSDGVVKRQENSNFRTNMDTSQLQQRRLLRQSQDLERREDEAMDAFMDQTFRSIERMMDESWE